MAENDLPDIELVLEPKTCVAGQSVTVTARILNDDEHLTYLLDRWSVTDGKLVPRPPREFPPGEDTIQVAWNTNGMSQGVHAIAFTVVASDAERRFVPVTATEELRVQPLESRVRLAIKDGKCDGEINSTTQGRVICLEAALEEDPDRGLEYAISFATAAGRVRGTRVKEMARPTWRATVSTDDLSSGQQTVQAFLSVRPADSDRPTSRRGTLPPARKEAEETRSPAREGSVEPSRPVPSSGAPKTRPQDSPLSEG